jgi:hypothetical protein
MTKPRILIEAGMTDAKQGLSEKNLHATVQKLSEKPITPETKLGVTLARPLEKGNHHEHGTGHTN